jgi:Xaa-Pro aminopeptidase
MMLSALLKRGTVAVKAVLLSISIILAGCSMPGGRSWIIPVTIDPSDLSVTPELRERFQERREQVMADLDGAVVILRSGQYLDLNRHQYRPDNYFYYLTGCDIPHTYMVLSDSDTPFTLSMPPESIRTLIYEGETLKEVEMEALYGPDRIVTSSEFRNILDTILRSDVIIYTDTSDKEYLYDLQRNAGEGNRNRFRPVESLVDELRVFKGSVEVERLQKACNITSQALVSVMRTCEPDRYEFEMEAIIEGTFLEYGAAMPGFPSIVGSGPNSTILHYERNDRLMESGDLLLMDIGAEYGYYTADITRTIPVSGRFTPEQRVIYQLVLDAQDSAIVAMKPGNTITAGHRAAAEVIIRGLYGLGLMTDTTSAWQQRFYIIYPASHFLGLDVHDVGEYGVNYAQFFSHPLADSIDSRILEPGMVLTIEPGLYFREKGLEQMYDIFGSQTDSTEIARFIETVSPVYANYMNIGVRIEDDILITQDGNINLSRYAPREIHDIEQIMR